MQALFWEEPRVLYCSTHQFGIFPGTGALTEVGGGAGEGANINVPLPSASGERAVLKAYDEVILPAAERFDPDLLIVSAGYDSHFRDPLAGMQLYSSTYR